MHFRCWSQERIHVTLSLPKTLDLDKEVSRQLFHHFSKYRAINMEKQKNFSTTFVQEVWTSVLCCFPKVFSEHFFWTALLVGKNCLLVSADELVVLTKSKVW